MMCVCVYVLGQTFSENKEFFTILHYIVVLISVSFGHFYRDEMNIISEFIYSNIMGELKWSDLISIWFSLYYCRQGYLVLKHSYTLS